MLSTFSRSHTTHKGRVHLAPTWHTPERILKRRLDHLLIGDFCQTPAGYPDAKIIRTRNKRYEVYCAGRCENFKTSIAVIAHFIQLNEQHRSTGIPVQLRLF